MGWLREKFKNIESRVDEIGEKFEGEAKQIEQKEQIRKEEVKKRQWKNLNWYQKLIVIIGFVFCIIFWIIIGPPLWKLLCKLW